jgi:hypothetical protein
MFVHGKSIVNIYVVSRRQTLIATGRRRGRKRTGVGGGNI